MEPTADAASSAGTAPDARPVALDEQRRGLLLILAALRGALLVWASIVVALDALGTTEVRLALAVALLVPLAAWSALLARWAQHRSTLVERGAVVAVDVAVGAVVAAADHLVYPGPHPQSFASAWPMTAAVVTGITRGPRSGIAAGFLISGVGAAGTAAFAPGGLDGRVTATIGTVVLLAVAGGLAGALSATLRRAGLAVARARAREEVARELHDGVLQTLAVVQRRSDDPALVALARDQELDLRRSLARPHDPDAAAGTDLLDALRASMSRVESRTGLSCTLSVIDAPPVAAPAVVAALAGASQEALANVHRHAGVDEAVICVDVECGLVHVSITDEGRGFDPASTSDGTGLTRSVRGRLAEVGGHVEVATGPGRGTEVHLWCVPDSNHDR